MKTKIFSVYDSKAQLYHQPIFARTTAVAIRMFATAANDETHEFHRHAGDYFLFEIGEWDEDNARCTSLENHINLGSAHSLIEASALGSAHSLIEASASASAAEQPVADINQLQITN
ncbi:nonstructural protein [Microviridae sp.]|nr:nonstructural protein [Microviridae sp.]